MQLPNAPSQTNAPIPVLSIAQSVSSDTLSWDQNGYTLQQAANPVGTWADAPGPVTTSPFTTTNPVGDVYFRLRK